MPKELQDLQCYSEAIDIHGPMKLALNKTEVLVSANQTSAAGLSDESKQTMIDHWVAMGEED